MQLEPNTTNSCKTKEVAPINRIPVEILTYILEILVEDSDTLVIARLLFVCQYWYNVIQNTPSLWARIVVSTTGEHIKTFWAPYVEMAVAKSGTRPLHLHFNFSHTNVEQGVTDMLSTAIGSEGEGMARCKSFFLRFKHEDAIPRHLWDDFDHPAPLLQELCLDMDRRIEWEGPFPALTSLVCTRSSTVNLMAFDVIQINTMILQGTSRTPLWLERLPTFINLRDLSIDTHIHCNLGGDCLYLPRLDCLTIRSTGSSSFPVTTLQRFSTPVLETLRLIGGVAVSAGLVAGCFRHVQRLQLLVDNTGPVGAIINVPILETSIASHRELEVLVVAPWHLEVAMEALRNLMYRYRAPQSLAGVTTLVRDGTGVNITNVTSWKSISAFEEVMALWRSTDDFIYEYYAAV